MLNTILSGIFYMILFSFTSNGQHNVCIFGSDISCFYSCHCHFTECSARDPDCEVCHSLVGLCAIQHNVCEFDEFVSSLYETKYWTGVACQKGNIAHGKLYRIEGLFAFPPANGGATDGTFTFAVSAFISPFSHTIIVDLEGDHVVEFVDLFLQFELPIAELNQFVSIRLESINGSISQCVFTTPSEENRLKNSTGLEQDQVRMHFQCEPPSIGHELKLETLETEGVNIPVTVFEVVIIGYKYANINLDNCLNIEGDAEIQWCTQCNNSKPPECRLNCEEGYTGVNCLNETEKPSTTPGLVNPVPNPQLVPLAVGVSLGALLLIACITVSYILYKRHTHRRKHVQRDLYNEPEEETYDEIDDIDMEETNKGFTQGIDVARISNEYLHANQVSSTTRPETLKDEYLTSKSVEKSMNQPDGQLLNEEKIPGGVEEHSVKDSTIPQHPDSESMVNTTDSTFQGTSAPIDSIHAQESNKGQHGPETENDNSKMQILFEENGSYEHDDINLGTDSCPVITDATQSTEDRDSKIDEDPVSILIPDNGHSLTRNDHMSLNEGDPYLLSKHKQSVLSEQDTLESQEVLNQEHTNCDVLNRQNDGSQTEASDAPCSPEDDDPYLTPVDVKPGKQEDPESTNK